jgi:hypothetical protein
VQIGKSSRVAGTSFGRTCKKMEEEANDRKPVSGRFYFFGQRSTKK